MGNEKKIMDNEQSLRELGYTQEEERVRRGNWRWVVSASKCFTEAVFLSAFIPQTIIRKYK